MTALLTAAGLGLDRRLADTALSLEQGTLCCLVGPNGSGKTSLLHALAGIGSPHGEVRIDGTDPRQIAPSRRQHLFAYLPASRDIKWPLTARDLIVLALPSDVRPDRVIEALDLGDLIDRRIDRLSTGERSRVLIARALTAEPRLLLLDEPTANLDPRWQIRLMDHLRERTRQGQTALVAMHDLDMAERYADRLILMNEGGIVADGDPVMILDGPHMAAVFGIERREGAWRLAP